MAWSFLILVWLLAIIQEINTSEVYELKEYLEFFHLDESRFLSTQNYTEGDKCVVKCFEDSKIPNPVRDFFFAVYRDVFKRENSTNIRRLFNATMLDWYCGLEKFFAQVPIVIVQTQDSKKRHSVLREAISNYFPSRNRFALTFKTDFTLTYTDCNSFYHNFRYANDRQECVLDCSDDGVVKREILKLMRPTSYICNETEFITYSKCYHKVYEEDLDECESGDKCLSYKMTMVDSAFHKRHQNISMEERIEGLFSNLCQYIICGNQCRLRELLQQCGEESNEILIEFYRRVVASLKQIVIEIYHYFIGKQMVIVDTCDQI